MVPVDSIPPQCPRLASVYVDNDGVIIAPETAGPPLVEYSREIFENPKAVVHGRVDVVLSPPPGPTARSA